MYVARLPDGSRKILDIAEVKNYDGSEIKLQNIFHYRNTGLDEERGRIGGTFGASGFCPTVLAKFEVVGGGYSHEVFKSHSVEK